MYIYKYILKNLDSLLTPSLLTESEVSLGLITHLITYVRWLGSRWTHHCESICTTFFSQCIPINLDEEKYWTCERCTFLIRSELKWIIMKMQRACFLSTSLKMEMKGKVTMRCWKDDLYSSLRSRQSKQQTVVALIKKWKILNIVCFSVLLSRGGVGGKPHKLPLADPAHFF